MSDKINSQNSSNIKPTVCVVGLGYIGLPTAATLCGAGFRVLGIDINADAVKSISQGMPHIHEPGLDVLVKTAVESNQLIAKMSFDAGDAADIFIIAVPTPFKENKKPDLSYVESATRSIAPVLKSGDTVILESTSPVGTTAKVNDLLGLLRPELAFPVENIEGKYDIAVAYCPERILPGKMLVEIIENDRVIGGLSPSCAKKAAHFYKKFVKGECITTKARTAAMCKLAENAYRDVNIAYANELSMICDEQGIDVWEMRELANRHPRVNILQPGPGVGGHCIAVDPWFIVDSAPNKAKLIRSAREVNDYKPEHVIESIIDCVNNACFKKVVFWGLSFKPDIDDLRESPAVSIVDRFSKKMKHMLINVVEPHIERLPTLLQNHINIQLVGIDDVEKSSDKVLHILLVGHKVFDSVKIGLGINMFFCGPTSSLLCQPLGITAIKTKC